MNNLQNTLEKNIINVIYKHFKKYKNLPKCGKFLVAKNVSKYGDMLDYMLDTKDGYVYVNYTYYEKSSEENKYIINSFKLCKEYNT